jgi:hypothetical protein
MPYPILRIKRSASTSTPGSLSSGELAYSFASNTLFIGTPANGVIAIAGANVASLLLTATDANNAGTIVRRSAGGSFAGRLLGNANSATTLETNRNFSINGDIVSTPIAFNGSSDVTISAALSTLIGSPGTYGSTTAIPVITVAANGRITSISTTTVDSSFSITGDSGSTTVDNGDSFAVTGGQGITSTVTDDVITLDVDNTVLRSNTSGARQVISTPISISGDLSVSGNLVISGETSYQNVTSLNISDPLIYLAANNYSSDIVDIGFAGNYYDGSTQRHTGIIRKNGTNEYYLFTNYDKEPNTNIINVNDASFVKANVNASYLKGNVIATTITSDTLSLTTALPVTSGGTGVNTFDAGKIVIGDGSNSLKSLTNSTYTLTGSLGASKTITSFTVDAYGRVTAATAGDIGIDASQITSGVLTYNLGGTGSSSYTQGQVLVAGPTGFVSLANSSYTLTGSLGANKTLTSLTVDVYGRVTAATGTPIEGLIVTQGGTGLSTITAKGVLFGNGTSAIQATSAAGESDQTWTSQILTVNASGTPVWSTVLDGGTF